MFPNNMGEMTDPGGIGKVDGQFADARRRCEDFIRMMEQRVGHVEESACPRALITERSKKGRT